MEQRVRLFLYGMLTMAVLWFLHTWYEDRVLLYQMFQFLQSLHG